MIAHFTMKKYNDKTIAVDTTSLHRSNNRKNDYSGKLFSFSFVITYHTWALACTLTALLSNGMISPLLSKCGKKDQFKIMQENCYSVLL